MAVVNHPDPPKNSHGGVWLGADGNVDWDAYAGEANEARWEMERLGEGRSLSRGFGGCATCDGGGCRDCR